MTDALTEFTLGVRRARAAYAHTTHAIAVAETRARPVPCPGCGHDETPKAVAVIPAGVMAAYECSTCGRAWVTDHEEEA